MQPFIFLMDGEVHMGVGWGVRYNKRGWYRTDGLL
jgi:hypothetical protein